MIRYIALFRSPTGNKKEKFDIDKKDVRSANKLARIRTTELLLSHITDYTDVLELVREDRKSNRIYSDGSGTSYLVKGVKY